MIRTACLHAPLLLLAACAPSWEPAFDEPVPPERFASVAIADPDEALTFARVRDGGRPVVLGVTDYRDGTVAGLDLTAVLAAGDADPIALFNAHGYDRLREVIRDAPAAARRTVAATALVAPVDLGAHHIAAATNFPAHADDAGVEDGPFLFAKLVPPTGPYDPLPAGDALLDYEVELAWVTLTPLAAGDGAPPYLGLVACNDVTDRDTLLRHLDPWDIASGAGFTTGKSFPGFLPIGTLFVVPRDHRRFVAGLALALAVDGALRQRAPAAAMVWDLDALLREVQARRGQRWAHRGGEIALVADDGAIPARTLLLAGTPHGTVFDGVPARHYVAGLGRWLAGGWDAPLATQVLAAYIDDAHAAAAYLQPGQRVEIHIDRLGVLRNEVVP